MYCTYMNFYATRVQFLWWDNICVICDLLTNLIPTKFSCQMVDTCTCIVWLYISRWQTTLYYT